jgi:hypothetical protein
MKIRNGFVSNSSSSSFVLKKNDIFPNSYSLAASMIKIREWENDDELIKFLFNKIEKGETYKNISFRSCNYDTYIIEEGDYLFCETCNNHSHWDITNYGQYVSKNEIPTDIAEEYMNEYGEVELPHDIYWFLEPDVIAKTARGWCPKCYTNMLDIDGIEQCPNCYKNKQE